MHNISTCPRRLKFGAYLSDFPSIKNGLSVTSYCDFGQHFYYGLDTNNECISKYNNLKEEMIQNQLYSVNLTLFTISYHKANKYLMHSHVIKSMKCDDNILCKQYGLNNNASISLEHVLSIILYCDCNDD